MTTRTFSKKAGYSLIETVIYAAILSIVFFVMINTLLSFNQSYRSVLVLRAVDSAGIDAMERITRDIRGAATIDSGASTLGTSPGVITVNAFSGSYSTTTRFYLQQGRIYMDLNGAYYGPITSSSATVTSLMFRKISNVNSDAVKIDMSVTASVGGISKTKAFHTTVVLKGID